MEVRIDRASHAVTIAVTGRLDASSADAFLDHAEQELRGGAEAIALDLSGVNFVSSVGLGALLRLSSRLRSSGARMAVIAASVQVTDMLRVTRLDAVLKVGPLEEAGHAGRQGSQPSGSHDSSDSASSSTRPRAAAVAGAHGPSDRASQATITLGDGTSLRGEARLASPEPSAPLLRAGRAAGRLPEPIALTPDLVAIGHAALASDAADASGRFGEALVVGGVAVVTSAAASRSDFVAIPLADRPDRMGLGAATAPPGSPSAWMLEGIGCAGVPRWAAWFDAPCGDVRLSALVAEIAALERGDCAVIVAGETSGLVGATARTSPDTWGDRPDPATLRSRVRFSTDRMHSGDTAVIVAFVQARDARARRAAGLPGGSPLDPDDPASPLVHAHAIAMSYRPVGRSALDAAQAVGSLLAEQRLRSVMHLVQPSRSGMCRGLAWRISIADPEALP